MRMIRMAGCTDTILIQHKDSFVVICLSARCSALSDINYNKIGRVSMSVYTDVSVH